MINELPIAVTGATGRLGGRIAHRLAAADIQQRLLVRDPARAPELPKTTAVRAEYGDRASVRDALDGVGTVLMVSAAEAPDRPAALTLAEVATILSTVSGRTITYHAESVLQAYESRASYGAPAWQLDAWVSTYTAIATGEMSGVTSDVADLTGHPATDVEQVVRALNPPPDPDRSSPTSAVPQ